MTWQLAEAKSKFSEVVRMALNEGPQRITRRGDAVVLISEEEYELLTGQRTSFVDHLMSMPSLEGVKLTRDPSPMREVDLS